MNEQTNITVKDVAKAFRVIADFYENLIVPQEISAPSEPREVPMTKAKKDTPTYVSYATIAENWGVRPDCIRGIMKECKLKETTTSANKPAIKAEDVALVVAKLQQKIGDYKIIPRNAIVRNAIVENFGFVRRETHKKIKNSLFVNY